MDKTEKKISSRKIYDGHILNLRVDDIELSNGVRTKREVVEHKDAAAVLAVDNYGLLLFVSQYRYAANAELLEIPAGLVENGENPQDTAVRELQEECGYKPEHIEKICSFFCSPGFSTETLHVYYAADLTESKLPQDKDEIIELVRLSVAEAEEKIRKGEIIDAKTIAAIYWYGRYKLDNRF